MSRVTSMSEPNNTFMTMPRNILISGEKTVCER